VVAERPGRTAAWNVGREVIKGHSRALGADPGILSPRCRWRGPRAISWPLVPGAGAGAGAGIG
jgi:hypothetical protein